MRSLALFLFACGILSACKKDADLSEWKPPITQPPFFVSGKINKLGDTASVTFNYRTGQVFSPGSLFNNSTKNYLVANTVIEDIIGSGFKNIAGVLELDSQQVFQLAFENPDSLLDGFSLPQQTWSKTELEQFFPAGKTFDFEHVTLILKHLELPEWREDSSTPADNQDSFVRVEKIQDLLWTEDGVDKAGKVINFTFQCRIAGSTDPNRVYQINEGQTTLYFGYQ